MEKYICLENDNDLNVSTLRSLMRVRYKIGKLENKIIKQERITIAQYDVLLVLYKNEELKINDLINKTLITPGNMTVIIKNLEREGLIKKQKDIKDKRSTKIHITEDGIKVVELIIPKHTETINRIFNELSESEKNILQNILGKINLD